MKHQSLSIRAVVILTAGLFFTTQAKAASKPNIIVIMADDLGYGDIGCYGAKPKNLKTPHIDKLAANGLRFTSGYCSASTCTPTRFSFLTGKYAFRQKGTGIAPPNSPAVIQPGLETLPSLLKKAGYATAVIGKWHLGLGDPSGPDWNGELKPGPREIGFDYNFLLPTTNDRVPQVYVENHRVKNLDPKDPLWVGRKKPSPDHPTGLTHRKTLKMDWSHGHNSTIHNGISRIGFYTGGHAARFRDEDLADEWVKQSNKWIEANKANPFFLFFSSHDLHVPRMPHERFHGKSGLGFRGDAIVQLDWCVGELVKTLDRLKLSDNTLIVFCSDNGPVGDDGYKDGALEKMGDHQPNGPFSGGKYSVLEGGTRTPFITYWPGHIAPGVSEEMVCTIDLAASFAALAGVKLPKAAVPDSFNVLNALLGKKGAKGRDHLVQQDNGRGGNYGYRVGNWKLQRHDAKRKRNVNVTEQLANSPAPRFALFDLSKDVVEKKNVAEQNPQVFERMKKELQEIIDAGRSRPQVKVSADFPSGSVKVDAVDAVQRVLRFQPATHKNRGWDCWWYFKVTGLEPGSEWTFDLGGTGFVSPRCAAFSANNRDWKQTEPGRREGKRIRYTLKVPVETLWLAWGPPFGLADAHALVKQVAGAKVGAEAFRLCASRDGHSVPALRWEPKADGRQPAIWIQARQHAWESGGSWVCRGLVEWLASKEGEALRARARIFVVPIMDVDNVERGAGGKNQIPFDHNRDWSDKPHWPEVAAAQKWIRRLDREDDFVLFLDLHNPGPNDNQPFYVGSPKSHLNPQRIANQNRFHQRSLKIMGKEPFGMSAKIRISGPGYHPLWRHISKNWVAKHTATGSVNFTLETSWNTRHSTQTGYRAYGRALGRTIAAFVLKQD